jgi:hypothetical protein
MKITTKQRDALPASKFALPEQRKYPVNDRAHAANAKARATQQFDKGNLSMSAKQQVVRAANRTLSRGRGS